MFPSTSSRETSELSGKQNLLFPSGPYIKCVLAPSNQISNPIHRLNCSLLLHQWPGANRMTQHSTTQHLTVTKLIPDLATKKATGKNVFILIPHEKTVLHILVLNQDPPFVFLVGDSIEKEY